MKRYNVYIQDSGPYAYIEADEEKDGDYVYWDDVEPLLIAAKELVIDRLPGTGHILTVHLERLEKIIEELK